MNAEKQLEELIKFIRSHGVDVDSVSAYLMNSTELQGSQAKLSTSHSKDLLIFLGSRTHDLREILLSIALAYSVTLETFVNMLSDGNTATKPNTQTSIDEFNKGKAESLFSQILDTTGKPH